MIKDLGRRMRDAFQAVEQSVAALTGYTNSPRRRSFLPQPSFGATFAIRSEQFSESKVVYYGSECETSPTTLEGRRDVKFPEKVHTVTQEEVTDSCNSKADTLV